MRIPLDYRIYTVAGNWDVFLDHEIDKIDNLEERGKKYGVHVYLKLHWAPGYCVNPSAVPANQELDFGSNSAAQEARRHIAKFITVINRLNIQGVQSEIPVLQGCNV